MSGLAETFIEKVSKMDIFQYKFLRKQKLLDEEIAEFEEWLNFYIDTQNMSIDEIVDDYLFLNKMVLDETKYFYRYGHYRYSTVREVEELVYANDEYMRKYMIGLSCSEYLWSPHLKMIRYFKDAILKSMKNGKWGGTYMEIGPGGGQYLIKSIESGLFSKYFAFDLSPSSVKLSNDILGYRGHSEICKVEEKDFFDIQPGTQYDCIVMGEVLEHVENPKAMLHKVRNLLSENGVAFVTTVITGPTIDHIYLFNNKDEVLQLVKDSGLVVKEYICATANDVPMEMAMLKKMAIDIAMVLER